MRDRLLNQLLLMRNPQVFTLKVHKRLRRYAEIIFPRWIFAYGKAPGAAEPYFLAWPERMPFQWRIPLNRRIAETEQSAIIKRAEAICRHEFDLLGSGPYVFGDRIDWHLDFKSQFRWPPRAVYSTVRDRTPPGADVKVPWELSRFNHSVALGLAWQSRGEERYVRELARQVEHWIQENPVGYGVNWACTMDVAIRAVNWLVAIALMNEPLMDDAYSTFRRLVVDALWQHAHFIRLHLEWSDPNSGIGANHLLSDLAGLYTIALFFKETTQGRNWLAFASEQLDTQITRQVFADGVHFECSPAYHRLCLEMFMWCGALARRAGAPFSELYYDRLGKMKQFTADCVSPCGIAPLIGDNDDGLFLTSGLQEIGDHQYLLPECDIGSFCIDRYLLDGAERIAPAGLRGGATYPDAGFYFLQSAQARVIVRAGRLAHAGAHAHNDQLSFELRLNERAFIVDRGTYVYTSDPKARNLYRSTSAHNTLQINGSEQNTIGPDVFGMLDHTNTRAIEQTEDTLTAEHGGFIDLHRLRLAIRRKFMLKSNSLEIRDTISPIESGDVLQWAFHLAPGWAAEVNGKEVRLTDQDTIQKGRLLIMTTGAQVELEEFPHSPSYGVLEHAKTLRVKYTASLSTPKEIHQFILSWSQK